MATHPAEVRTAAYPTTPDGRYFVVRGRLWRCSNLHLAPAKRAELIHELMTARSAKGRAMRAGDTAAREQARARVDAAKHALGERGAPWWTDGAPDYNRKMARNTPYAGWFESLPAAAHKIDAASKKSAAKKQSRSSLEQTRKA